MHRRDVLGMKRKRATKVLKRVRNKSGTLQRHVNMDLEHLEHVSCPSRSMGHEAQAQKTRYACSYKVHSSCPTISELSNRLDPQSVANAVSARAGLSADMQLHMRVMFCSFAVSVQPTHPGDAL